VLPVRGAPRERQGGSVVLLTVDCVVRFICPEGDEWETQVRAGFEGLSGRPGRGEGSRGARREGGGPRRYREKIQREGRAKW
jgi:hypothetical protein